MKIISERIVNLKDFKNLNKQALEITENVYKSINEGNEENTRILLNQLEIILSSISCFKLDMEQIIIEDNSSEDWRKRYFELLNKENEEAIKESVQSNLKTNERYTFIISGLIMFIVTTLILFLT